MILNFSVWKNFSCAVTTASITVFIVFSLNQKLRLLLPLQICILQGLQRDKVHYSYLCCLVQALPIAAL
ncbi:unknown [Salmonella phage FelixO1]|uniref:Uncharacterized protein n=1 Tax=Salmonella phage Felix O1 (isolate Felix O1-VT1) TaxID=1283336 RepID=Q6KG65_BPFO1|nr:unknown [Salmonella phage FelixO1]